MAVALELDPEQLGCGADKTDALMTGLPVHLLNFIPLRCARLAI